MSGSELTVEDVKAIYDRLQAGHKGAAIARDFAVSQQAVSAIRTGTSWGHVTGLRPGDPRAHTHRGTLTRDQVLDVDAALRAGMPVAELARMFGVTYQTIYAIRLGTSWSWLTGRPVLKPKRKESRG